jgi:hypothetical protein
LTFISCSHKQKHIDDNKELTHNVVEFEDENAFIGFGGFFIVCKAGLIGVSKDNQILWAIGYNPENMLVWFDLDEKNKIMKVNLFGNVIDK